LIGELSGGGTPATASSSNPSVRPPRDVRTLKWGITTSMRGVWGLWSGAATGRCWAGMGGSPARPPWVHPFPWGPSRGPGHTLHPTVSLRVPVRGLFPSVPLGGPVGHPLCPPACPHLPVPSRSPSVSPGCPLGRDFPRGVPPAPARPNWIAPPLAGGRGSDVSRRGGPSEEVRGLEAERVAGASPGSSMVRKRCTSRLRSTLLCRLPRGSVSV